MPAGSLPGPSAAARRAHIVLCHPEPRSFAAAMAHTAQAALERAGWQVSLSDLHAKGFNPVASGADFMARRNPAHLVYALEQRHAVGEGTLAADIAAELEPVLAAELLVLVFPVWWYSMPAMLKGWIDRVFLSGTFYGGRRIYDAGGMRGRRALVLTSVGGREHMFGPDAIHGELAGGMLRHLLQGTLGYVGYAVHEPFVAWHVPYVNDAARRAMLATLEAELGRLDERPTLPMPSVHDHDAEFRPLAIRPRSRPSAHPAAEP